MEIAYAIVFAVGGILLAGYLFNVHDLIMGIYDRKIEAARERRLEAEARAEEARIKHNSTHTN